MIETGKSISRNITIDPERTIAFMGPELRVYATPRMIADVEMACRDLLLPMLEDGKDTVGIHVSMDHLGPALAGDTVTVEATIVKVDRSRITFEASVTCNGDKIGAANHIRAVIAIADQLARLRARANKGG